MTIVSFPQEVNIQIYYDKVLEKLMSFLKSSDSKLVVDLQTTNKIYPDVICSFLAFLKYQYLIKGAYVYLLFGDSSELSSFLDNTGFFQHAEVQTLFSYNYISGISTNKYREANTNKIVRFDVPNFTFYTEKQKEKIVIPDEIKVNVQKQVIGLYSNKYKEKIMKGISNEEEILPGLMEIVENAYKHSYAFQDSCCYYTFQSYGKAGFTFACSDIGIGLYDSFHRKFINQDEPINPKIFSRDEYERFSDDMRKKDLGAIFECIAYRIEEKYPKGDFGFPFILRKLIIQNNGLLTIRNGRITLSMDKSIYDKLENDLFTMIPKLNQTQWYAPVAYTPHDYDHHVKRVLQYASHLLQNALKANIFLKEELQVLQYACMLHDIDMVYNPEDREKHSAEARIIMNPYSKTDVEDVVVADLLNKAKKGIDTISTKEDVKTEEEVQAITKVQAYLTNAIMFLIPNDELRDAIGQVIIGHTGTFPRRRLSRTA